MKKSALETLESFVSAIFESKRIAFLLQNNLQDQSYRYVFSFVDDIVCLRVIHVAFHCLNYVFKWEISCGITIEINLSLQMKSTIPQSKSFSYWFGLNNLSSEQI